MFQKRRAVLALSVLFPLLVAAAAPPDPAKLRDSALQDDVGLAIAADLTTEIGPRPAGSEAEARARAWAVARLKALGFKNVRIEPFEVQAWQRGEERGALVLPYAQPLALTALGYSGATPAEGLEAPVVTFDSVAALQAATDAQVAGKIVYVGHEMRPAQDGSSYGYFGPVRRSAPSIAARKGAAAIVIRSLGTDSHRVPHTGTTNFEPGVAPIPAAALSNPDADLIERIAATGKPMRLRMLLTPRALGVRPSGNVVAEIPGSDPKAGIVAIGGHLDSWDLGTGAIDNAAGVAITAAAAKRIMAAGVPKRTIRLIWFGSEEVGGVGGQAYFDAHKAEPHAVVAESDFGADRVWRVQMALPAAAEPVAKRLESALAPLGIGRSRTAANAGADLGPWVKAGSNGVDLNQDGTHYFDLHHTADDTFDKIDPAQFRQNVAAWTAMLAVVGWADEPLLNQNSLTGAR
jgi:Zn-dependent M28 family amino/carboxypeptidase